MSYRLEEWKREVLLAWWKIVFFIIDSKNPVTLPSEKLLVSIWCRIAEHEIRFPIHNPVVIFNWIGGQNTARNTLISFEKQSISFMRAPITEEWSLTLELEVRTPIHSSYGPE